MNTKIKTIAALACGVVACGLGQSARANLVSNGSFSTPSSATGQINHNGFTVSGWNVTGTDANNYDFIFNGANADSVGANGIDGNVSLWGPNTPNATSPRVTFPVANGLGVSPDGGTFLGVDPQYRQGSTGNNNVVSQTISGLTPNTTYTLSFYWAAAQQSGFNSPNNGATPTTEAWDVTFAGVTKDTTTYSLVNHGFSGWMLQTMTFTTGAGVTSSTLSFLAAGGPSSSEPPFDLLDGVNLSKSVPDSSSTAGLLGLGVVAMGVAAGYRRFARA